MRKLIAIFVCCQLLLLNGVAWAHMGSEGHDPHEAIHVHTGDQHDGDHLDGSHGDHEDGHEEGHDGSSHLHLCALALNTLSSGNTFAPSVAPVSPVPTWRSCAHSPPVPPPNA